MRCHSLHTLLLTAAAATLLAAPGQAQERRPDRGEEDRVVVMGPSRVEMALARRKELKLSEEQVRRLEAARAEADRQASAILNATQRAELDRHQQRMRVVRERFGPGRLRDAECERGEDGKRVECRRIVIRHGPGGPRGEHRLERGRRFRLELDGPRGRLDLPFDTAGAQCETRTEGDRKIVTCRREVHDEKERGRRR